MIVLDRSKVIPQDYHHAGCAYSGDVVARLSTTETTVSVEKADAICDAWNYDTGGRDNVCVGSGEGVRVEEGRREMVSP
ncbi:hypothetical protein GBAR_LOCUS29342 [Geodia barretti]|uniref:Uncharacterized protein n=1 Tax=Geodia barretti TaxID=519541 RepID=A0AA35XCI4_GEOBA|nr:hypothetical protein GBAR_LOCUS29342 [Geodia barretti]